MKYELEKFRPEDAVKQDIKYKENWRLGETGDWVETDDGWIVQVLKKYNTKRGNDLLKFAHRTVPVRNKMILTIVGNQYPSAITSGNTNTRKLLSRRHKLLIKAYTKTRDWNSAYRLVYGSVKVPSMKRSMERLFQFKDFQEYFTMAIKDELDNAGLDKDYVFGALKKYIDSKSKHGYEALIKLMELHNISEPNRGVLGIPMMELNQIEPATFEDVEGEQKDEDKV